MKNQIFISIVRIGSKAKKDGKAPLWLKVHFGGTNKRKQYSLSSFNTGPHKMTATDDEWITEASRYRKRYDPRNEQLKTIEQNVDDYKKQIKDNGVTFSLDGLERAVFTLADSSSFTSLIDAQIKALNAKDRFSYATSFKSTQSLVNLFTSDKDFPISDITKEWLEKFDWFMQGKDYTKNTRGINMRNLRRLFNLAIQGKIVNSSQYPFGFNGFTIGSSTATKRPLTKDQMIAMISVQVPAPLRNAQNYFALSYLGGGINFKDMALWRWDENVNNKRIVFFRSKTHRKKNQKPHSIALSGRIAEIISEYTQHPGYILPIIFSDDPKVMRNQTIRALVNTNKDLKEIARMVGVPEPDKITFYFARHTFANVLKKQGHSVEMIKELIGHTDTKTTQIYLDSFDDDDKDEVMGDLL